MSDRIATISTCPECGLRMLPDEMLEHAQVHHTSPTDEQVAELAERLYTAAANTHQVEADATAHLRTKDRNGVPVEHRVQPWDMVPGDFQRLWLERAREQLEAQEPRPQVVEPVDGEL